MGLLDSIGLSPLGLGIGLASTALGLKSNSDNRDIAQQQFAQNIYQQDTAHQREVADLAKAGLNPILSATGGGGAPTGGGVLHSLHQRLILLVKSPLAHLRLKLL